ncbi:hypothetical protein K435DRAFT_860245 [Dendrothele bispora CBS 962.96]|uniref:DUF6589 domain-containing protein n=1 Tax=Dendrothele bispora (strain CBS 962.96) TaxID=1314807 RepID=A0A4S8LYP5_DENBC|nr:hypothetical protein K435DRAFT_860245 [Dendrothele bispora CBS 962.96]
MTVVSLIADIDWDHIGLVSVAHIIHVLIGYSPELHHLQSELSALFRTKFAKHPLSLRKTEVQPLGTNDAREIETKGMIDALEDFDSQMGLGPEVARENITWTMLDHIVENHQGPATSSDPSTLSRSYNRTEFKIPSNVKNCDFYPTINSMTKVFEAQVLDCWRVHYSCSEIRKHMKKLKSKKRLPSLDELFLIGEVIYDKYFTQQSYERAINQQRHHSSPDNLKFLNGSPWTQHPIKSSPTTDNVVPNSSNDNHNIPELDAPTAYVEGDNFTRDHVLANSILFKSEFVLWLEMAYTIPEGDIGRAFEILKVRIIHFAGGSHPNYVLYLLDIYCLIWYESSQDLKNALLNNWLVNLTGELGKWIEGDLMQEYFNRWVEDMISKHGGSFNNPFYRSIISPNVCHFLHLKESIIAAYGLEQRSLTHTSAKLDAEMRNLLLLYKQEELHLFRIGRSLGHAAKNSFEAGYNVLDGGKLKEYLDRSRERVDLLSRVLPSQESSQPVSKGTLVPDPPLHIHTYFQPDSNADDGDELNIPNPIILSGSISHADSDDGSQQSSAPEDDDYKSSSDGSYHSNASNTSTEKLESWEDIEYVKQYSGSDDAIHVVGSDGELMLQYDMNSEKKGGEEESDGSDFEETQSDMELFEMEEAN